MSWSGFLCCRCWTARVLILGLGGGLNENFLAVKKVRMAAATSAILDRIGRFTGCVEKPRCHFRHEPGKASVRDHFGRLLSVSEYAWGGFRTSSFLSLWPPWQQLWKKPSVNESQNRVRCQLRIHTTGLLFSVCLMPNLD